MNRPAHLALITLKLIMIQLELLFILGGMNWEDKPRIRISPGRITLSHSERGANFARSESWQIWPLRWPIPHKAESVSTP